MEKFWKSKVETLSSISFTCGETRDQLAETKKIEKEKELLSSAKINPSSSRTLPYFETRRAAKRWEFTMVHGIGERNTIICPKKSCGTKSLHLSRHRWVAGISVPSRNLYTRAQTISYTNTVILPSLPPSSTKHNTARQTWKVFPTLVERAGTLCVSVLKNGIWEWEWRC